MVLGSLLETVTRTEEEKAAFNRQKKIAREQEVERKARTRLEKEQRRDEKRQAIVSDAVDFLELVVIGGILYLLRKPLGHVLHKITSLISKRIELNVEQLEEDLVDWELRQRQKVVGTYLANPFYAAYIGGNLYYQLVTMGGWDTKYTSIKDPAPAGMDPTFVVGTGKASYWTTSDIIHMNHIECEMLCRFLVAEGGPLTALSDHL